MRNNTPVTSTEYGFSAEELIVQAAKLAAPVRLARRARTAAPALLQRRG